MTFGALAASAAFGLFGGGLAGLFGIGGGAVLVPFLYLVLEAPGWSGVLIPDGMVAQLDISLTDESGLAHAMVIISANPKILNVPSP